MGTFRPTLLFCFILAYPNIAGAAGELDQQFIDLDGITTLPEVHGEYIYAQTFTVGKAGLLDRVELQLERRSGDRVPTAPLVVELRRTVAGVPDATAGGVLAAVTVPALSVPLTVFREPFLGVDLGAQAVPVSVGDMLALSLRSDTLDDRGYFWAIDNDEHYARGEFFTLHPTTGGVFIPLSRADPSNPRFIDGGFRTFVTVPEPVIAGALLLRRVRRYPFA